MDQKSDKMEVVEGKTHAKTVIHFWYYFLNIFWLLEPLNLEKDVIKDESGAPIDTAILKEDEEEEIDGSGKSKKISFLVASWNFFYLNSEYFFWFITGPKFYSLCACIFLSNYNSNATTGPNILKECKPKNFIKC